MRLPISPMSAALALSLTVNFGLLGARLIERGQNAPAEPSAEVEPLPRESPVPFRWEELESTDYKSYVANLRSIGCPEATIRDIVTADVASLYRSKKEQAKSLESEAVAREQLDRLDREQAREVSQILEPAAATDRMPAQTMAASPERIAQKTAGVEAQPAGSPGNNSLISSNPTQTSETDRAETTESATATSVEPDFKALYGWQAFNARQIETEQSITLR